MTTSEVDSNQNDQPANDHPSTETEPRPIIPPPVKTVSTANENSPPWNRPTKIGVAVASISFAILILWRFQTLITPLVIAVIVAYLLNPIIGSLDRHSRFQRTTVNIFVHVLLAIILIGALVALGFAAYNQVVSLTTQIPEIVDTIPGQIEQVREFVSQPIKVGSFEFSVPISTTEQLNTEQIASTIMEYVSPALQNITGSIGSFVIAVGQTIGWMVFIFFVSVYLSNDIPRIGTIIGDAATLPGYREDAERLWREFGRVWNAYLRGQAILGVVIGVAVTVCLRILGVENSLALGLLSGLLEFIPVIGPLIGAGAAVIVALFQPENYLGLTNIQFALAVAAVMMLIQQVENNFLVPRIVGDALDLHPLLVLVGALMGSSLAGILGAILAAPVIATLKLIGSYASRKMFDLEPFPKPEVEEGDEPSYIESLWEKWQLRRAKSK
ncbi:MAG: AI-2E family transporter [Anaerolineales bacterium]|nr:AI-2E family transporter [Anaerolineales bacterium]